MRRTPGALALYGLVTILLIGATSAFVILNKQVTISVDGETRTLSSFAGTVGGVLEAADVEYEQRDLVVPAASESVEHGTRIVVTHARELDLTVDGKKRTVWVTANTVREALDQLDVEAGGAALSVDRSRRLPLSGFSLQVRLPREITVKVGGSKLTRATTAPTVRKALARAGIEVGKHDFINADLGKRPKKGQVIKITQVVGKPERRTVTIEHQTETREDQDMAAGGTEVRQQGRDGRKEIVVATIKRNGKKVEEVISSKVVRKPRKEIIAEGTKPREVQAVADLNWSALAECESGGDPNAVNPVGPYYGLYQFNVGTWQSVGGEGVPTDAPASEQTYRAQLLYEERGDGAWPHCGSRLYE